MDVECLAPCLIYTKHSINDIHYSHKCEVPPTLSVGAGVRGGVGAREGTQPVIIVLPDLCQIFLKEFSELQPELSLPLSS